MINLDLHSHPVKMKEVAIQSMPPDTILLNLDNGYYYSTNPVGAAVWERCDGRSTIADIMGDISQVYGIPAEDIVSDIMHFIKDMIEEGLVAIE